MSKTKTISNVHAAILSIGGTINTIKVPNTLKVDRLDCNKISSIFKSRGRGSIERECDYEWENNTFSIFAWTDGSAGNENKHELPPPIDNNLYFGDILVIKHNDGKLLNLTMDDYNMFYENAFGGFENLGSENSWSSEEELNSDDSIHEFIVDDEDESDGDKSEDEEEAISSDEDEDEDDDDDISGIVSDGDDDTSESTSKESSEVKDNS